MRCALSRERAGEKSLFSVSSKMWMLTVVPSSPGWSQMRPPSTSSSRASSLWWSSPPFSILLAYSVSRALTFWSSASVGSIQLYWWRWVLKVAGFVGLVSVFVSGILLCVGFLVYCMSKGKTAVKEAYPELFVSFTEDVGEGDFEFEFELQRELRDEEWHRMPEMLKIYDVEATVFRGVYQ